MPLESDPDIRDPVSGFAELLRDTFRIIPGYNIITRYIASSYQNDPIRSFLELVLFIFAVRTILQNRSRSSWRASNFVQLTEKVLVPLLMFRKLIPLSTNLNPSRSALC